MNAIFSYNQDVSRNAYLNWRIDVLDNAANFYVLASDYADGAITLMNTVLADNSDKKADGIIMPILYCIDQSIELYLKAIIRKIDMIVGKVETKCATHDIRELLNQLISRIKKKETKTKELNAALYPLKCYIDELYSKIQIAGKDGHTKIGIDFARYPISTEGISHFYINSDDNIVIDVENLGMRFDEIRKNLDGLYLLYDSEMEMREECKNSPNITD